jgi:hypothetical protein
MQSFQYTCCERYSCHDIPDYHGELIIIEGLKTPIVKAENHTEALKLLHDWLIEHKCRPYREVI